MFWFVPVQVQVPETEKDGANPPLIVIASSMRRLSLDFSTLIIFQKGLVTRFVNNLMLGCAVLRFVLLFILTQK